VEGSGRGLIYSMPQGVEENHVKHVKGSGLRMNGS
jgi:hypothetical protein